MKDLKLFNHFGARLFLTAVFLLALVAGVTSPAAAASQSAFGAVYTMTNAASGNEVLVYNRSSDGSLAFQGSFATDGLGSGAGLGSQSAVTLSHNNHWLFAVNAGSNQISSFAVTESGLELVDIVNSGGTLPVSLTTYKDWLYVLNAGAVGTSVVLRLDKADHCRRSPVPLNLSATAAWAQHRPWHSSPLAPMAAPWLSRKNQRI